MKLRFRYKDLGKGNHLLTIIFESEKSKKKWNLYKLHDTSYIQMNIHHIIRSGNFSRSGITDFRQETTMFPKAIYTIPDEVSSDIWQYLEKIGFKEKKRGISIFDYTKEILLGIKNKAIAIKNFYLNKKVLSLLTTFAPSYLCYYITNSWYSLIPIGLHIAVYFLYLTVIMVSKLHNSITYQVLKRKENE